MDNHEKTMFNAATVDLFEAYNQAGAIFSSATAPQIKERASLIKEALDVYLRLIQQHLDPSAKNSVKKIQSEWPHSG